jgi:hypothetical protein
MRKLEVVIDRLNEYWYHNLRSYYVTYQHAAVANEVIWDSHIVQDEMSE